MDSTKKRSGNRKSSASRSASSKKAAQTRAENLELARKKRESRGVACIAVAIVLTAYLLFSGSGILGEFLSHMLFGLCGWTAYALPVIFLAAGIGIISGSRRGGSGNYDWTLILGVWSFLTLAQAIRNAPYKGEEYFAYISAAYQDGEFYRRGGGAIGSIMCYPLQQFGGNVLAYTVTIAVLLIVIIMLTRLSLQEVGLRVGEGVQAVAQSVKNADKRLFVLEVEDKKDVETDPEESYFEKPKKRRKHRGELDGFDEAAAAFSDSLGSRKKPLVREGSEDLSYLPDTELHGPSLKNAPLTRNGKHVRAGTVDSGDEIWNELEPDDALLVESVRPAPRKPVPGAKVAPTSTFVAPFSAEELLAPDPAPAAAPKKRAKAAAPAEDAAPVPDPAAEMPPAYVPPSFSLLNAPPAQYGAGSENPADMAKLLVDTLASFNIAVKVLNISVGPVITRFELQPAPGVRVSRITGLSNDIALALSAPRVRIEAPIPGKPAVGIEIPNKNAVTVVLRDIVESREFRQATSPITMALGKDIAGKVIVADLGKMPHMLIAGSTGSGKSVCINDLIISMVYKSSPQQLRMILIDPKMVELSVFAPLPHLLIPVVTDPKKAAGALRWAVNEMTQRYKKFSETGAREITRYNELQPTEETKYPRLVVIIDELADLMMVAPDEVEDSICRIAQLGRACGIHLIVATQRPSADIITGLIKANIPSRCAFAVSSGIDSRIILDATGAEKLLGRGDMLFHPNGSNKPTRLQCAFVSDEEVERIVDYFHAQQQTPVFDEKFVTAVTTAVKPGATGGVFGEGKQEDELLGEAVRIVIESGQASISMIQRRLRVGYARAARLIDMMEQEGFVSGFDGSKARKVLIKRSEFEQLFGEGAESAGEAPDAGDEPPFDMGDDA